MLKRSLANRTNIDLAELIKAIKHRLEKLQYRPEVVDGVLAAIGLDLALD